METVLSEQETTIEKIEHEIEILAEKHRALGGSVSSHSFTDTDYCYTFYFKQTKKRPA